MTPLAAIGEAVKTLRTRISKNETRTGEFEKAVTDGFVTQAGYINELFSQVEALKAENQDLRVKIEHQDETIVQVLDAMEALRFA